jgi:hypothetical protein
MYDISRLRVNQNARSLPKTTCFELSSLLIRLSFFEIIK